MISKNINLKFPRAYEISDQKTLNVFIKDYKLTAVLGSLKHIIYSRNAQAMIFNANGTVNHKNKFILGRHIALKCIVSVKHNKQ